MTKIMHVNEHTQNEIISNVMSELDKNELVIIPTDTVHGFFCAYDNQILEKKIRDAKIRDEKPFIHLVNSIDMLKQYSATEIPRAIFGILPAPLTFIVNSKIIKTENSSIALRYPENTLLNKLTGLINKPCISTSANLSGEPIPDNPENLIKIFEEKCSLIVIDKTLGNTPSTILDIRQEPYKILRHGAVIIPEQYL